MPTDMIMERYPSCFITIDPTSSLGIPASKCVVCKGRYMCGQAPCPILDSLQLQCDRHDVSKRKLVGRTERIVTGSLSPSQDVPGVLFQRYYCDEEIPSCERESMYHSLMSSCHALVDKRQQSLQELEYIALSQCPLDISVELSSSPAGKIIFDSIDPPVGNMAQSESIKIIDDPDIPKFIEELISKDISPNQAITAAYNKGYDIRYLINLTSMGLLGIQNKHLHSKLATTTVYSNCSQAAIRAVKKLPLTDSYHIVASTKNNNKYCMIILPRPWEFELIESWAPGSIWTLNESGPTIIHEHETYKGTSDKAIREGGSYYPSRLSAAEQLIGMRIQGACIMLRSICAESSIPFGSGEVYTALTDANMCSYDTLQEALLHAATYCGIEKRTIDAISMMLSQGSLLKWF